MKRFKWPLQRLLDVTIQRENAVQSELLSLSRELARVHQEIFYHRAKIRAMLSDLEAEPFPQRIPKQEVFMESSRATEKRIEQLKAKAAHLKVRRQEGTARLTKIRKSKETLERRRQGARGEHVRQELRFEQKEFDEIAQRAFTREAITKRVRRSGTGA
jgi:flagellar export protein FliJ